MALLTKILLDTFLKTQLGFALRATGDNPQMICAQGVNIEFAKYWELPSLCLRWPIRCSCRPISGVCRCGSGNRHRSIRASFSNYRRGLLGEKPLFITTLGVLLGSFVYRFSISLVLSFRLAQASDLKLLTAIVVIIALTAPQIKRLLKSHHKGALINWLF